MQKIFLESDGKVPIHMVLPRDRFLTNFTFFLCVVGIIDLCYVWGIRMMKP